MLGGDSEGNDVPPHGSLVNSALGRERQQPRSLGEYDASTYPLPRKKIESKEEPASVVGKTPVRKPAAKAPAKSKTASRKPAMKSKSAA